MPRGLKTVYLPTGPVLEPISAYGYAACLDVGDAGAGARSAQYQYIYSQLAEVDVITGTTFNEMPNRITFVNMPTMGNSIDFCRPQFYHIKWAGRCLPRYIAEGSGAPLPLSALPEYENQIPTMLKGWLETSDGQFQIFDVIGRRGVSVYSSSIAAGFMAPVSAYIVSQKELSNAVLNPQLFGITSLDYVLCEAFPIRVNDSQNNDEVTIDVLVGVDVEEYIIVPPGSRLVAINSPTDGAVDCDAFFSIMASAVGIKNEITLVDGDQTPPLRIPDTAYVVINNTRGAVEYSFSLTFTKEL